MSALRGADWRLEQLGVKPMDMIEEHPLPWLASLLNGVGHANKMILSLSKGETRATEYSKAATRGNWNEVWDSFDSRKRANAANDLVAESANNDMFGRRRNRV